jgi:hypothetical protein
VAGSCEKGNETLGPIESQGFHDQVSIYYQVFKEDCAMKFAIYLLG